MKPRGAEAVAAPSTIPAQAPSAPPAGTSGPKLELGLDAGNHIVVARRDGYDEAAVPLVLAPGTSRDLAVTLEQSVPLTRKWWFRTAIGAVVVGGVTVTAVLLTEKPAERGSLSPGQVSVPLRF